MDDVQVEAFDQLDASVELEELRARANKLSEELKKLNSDDDQSSLSSMIELDVEEDNFLLMNDTDEFDKNEFVVLQENKIEVTKKERNFVKLLNKPDVPQDAKTNFVDMEECKESNTACSGENSPKKSISFILPGESASTLKLTESPSEDFAVIDDESSESNASEQIPNFEIHQESQSIQKAIHPNCDGNSKNELKAKIEKKAEKIEQSLGRISKQKYFSDRDTRSDDRAKVGRRARSADRSGFSKFQQSSQFCYPDLSTAVPCPHYTYLLNCNSLLQTRCAPGRGRNYWLMPFREKLYR